MRDFCQFPDYNGYFNFLTEANLIEILFNVLSMLYLFQLFEIDEFVSDVLLIVITFNDTIIIIHHIQLVFVVERFQVFRNLLLVRDTLCLTNY